MYTQYLLTGATGFLGRAVAEELIRQGARVRGLAPALKMQEGEVEDYRWVKAAATGRAVPGPAWPDDQPPCLEIYSGS